MNTFIDFLKEYKEVLITGLTLIITLVFMFIKRRPKTIDDFLYTIDEVICKLPIFINSVESPGFGLSKKKDVLSKSINLLTSKLGRDLSETELTYALNKFDSSIESILSTPQKKEANL